MRDERPAASTIAGIIEAPCYRIALMSDVGLHIRCMRCGAEMEMRDPAPDRPWAPDQFWVCPRCGRHFWTTYPPPAREKPKAAEPAS
jgi:transposase-like protein